MSWMDSRTGQVFRTVESLNLKQLKVLDQIVWFKSQIFGPTILQKFFETQQQVGDGSSSDSQQNQQNREPDRNS